jgi:hypothetical protein
MIGFIGVAATVFIATVLVFASTKPDIFKVQRMATIKAAPETLFALINDLRSHLQWSPFEKDPAIKRNFSGAEAGPGSVYSWEGNRQVGAGRIEITDASEPSSVTMQLQMYRPFKADNLVEFAIKPNGAGTDVSWTMSGRQPFMAKIVATLVNCDKMVGKEFEAGLAKLKALAEG